MLFVAPPMTKQVSMASSEPLASHIVSTKAMSSPYLFPHLVWKSGGNRGALSWTANPVLGDPVHDGQGDSKVVAALGGQGG